MKQRIYEHNHSTREDESDGKSFVLKSHAKSLKKDHFSLDLTKDLAVPFVLATNSNELDVCVSVCVYTYMYTRVNEETMRLARYATSY